MNSEKKVLPLISVIIPVFNVQNFVEKCLNSIVSQTYKNLEIIVVDDGSTDKSLTICKKIQTFDNRIIIYSKDNGGLSSARNYALDKCKGDYVYFVDSDDYLENNAILELFNSLCDGDLIAVARFIKEDTLGNPISCYTTNKKEFRKNYTSYEALSFLLDVNFSDFFQVAWNKLIKKEIVMRFPLNKFYEDAFIAHHEIMLAKHISFVNKITYHYVERESSIMTSKISVAKLIDYFEYHVDRYNFFDRNNFKTLKKKYKKDLYKCGSYLINQGNKKMRSRIFVLVHLIGFNFYSLKLLLKIFACNFTKLQNKS